MLRFACIAVLLAAAPAHADGVFEVCKHESKTVVTGTGTMSIAVVYPDDFPVTTTPVMRNAVGERLANAEKAKIVPAKDVEASKKLVGEKKWKENSDVCGYAPSLVAVLGQMHPNLATARASVACDAKNACELHVDLERHGRPTAERFVRYTAPLAGPKDKVDTITATAPKLKPIGAPPDAPKIGLAVSELASGVVTMRSDVDGALELDRTMEGNPGFAACGPKGRKPNQIRGFWAEWKLSARGNPYEVTVKPFQSAAQIDWDAAKCLRDAMQKTQLACPRDGKVISVKTAICL